MCGNAKPGVVTDADSTKKLTEIVAVMSEMAAVAPGLVHPWTQCQAGLPEMLNKLPPSRSTRLLLGNLGNQTRVLGRSFSGVCAVPLVTEIHQNLKLLGASYDDKEAWCYTAIQRGGVTDVTGALKWIVQQEPQLLLERYKEGAPAEASAVALGRVRVPDTEINTNLNQCENCFVLTDRLVWNYQDCLAKDGRHETVRRCT